LDDLVIKTHYNRLDGIRRMNQFLFKILT